MRATARAALGAMITALLLASCGPLVGAGVAVGADQVAEEEDRGDGLF